MVVMLPSNEVGVDDQGRGLKLLDSLGNWHGELLRGETRNVAQLDCFGRPWEE